jgi:hypothetical protein
VLRLLTHPIWLRSLFFLLFPTSQQQQVSWFDFCWDSNIGKTKKVNEF